MWMDLAIVETDSSTLRFRDRSGTLRFFFSTSNSPSETPAGNHKEFIPAPVRHLQFADDIEVYLPTTGLDDHLILQEAVDGVSWWCRQNGMELYTPKCVVLKDGDEQFDDNIEGSIK